MAKSAPRGERLTGDAIEHTRVRGLHFVCPMVNGVVASGLRVAAPAVADANPVSKMFHERA